MGSVKSIRRRLTVTTIPDIMRLFLDALVDIASFRQRLNPLILWLGQDIVHIEILRYELESFSYKWLRRTHTD